METFREVEMSKSTLWYAHFPGEVYANSFRFDRPYTETEARRHVRGWYNGWSKRPDGQRLPNGTEVWPSSLNPA